MYYRKTNTFYSKIKFNKTFCTLVNIIFALSFISIILNNKADAFCFSEAGAAYGISPQLLKGISKVESNHNPRAINRNLNGSVDIGLMQINSSWINRLNLDADRLLTDSCYNVMTGAKILHMCMDKYGYTWEAVGCYNALSKQKRVDYSWKVLEMLKAQQKNIDQSSSTNTSKTFEQDTGMTSVKRPQTLTFSVKDIAAIE